MSVDQRLYKAHNTFLAAADLAVRMMFDDLKPEREQALHILFNLEEALTDMNHVLDGK
jgi:hypothetical protein